MNRFGRIRCLWKPLAVAAIACVLVIGLTGCDLGDVLGSFNVGDIPFGETQTAPTDMGVVDDRPDIPEDEDFDDLRQDPI